MISLTGRPLSDFQEEHVNLLLADGVPEGKSIDYKVSLPGDTYDEKREFLADVSSFANTIGGCVAFGIREEGGVPVSIEGVEVDDLDGLKLRLENLSRNGLSPRLPSIAIHPVALESGRFVLFVGAERSFVGPHRVTLRGHDKFYARNSAGKYPMDVGQLRYAFTQQLGYEQQIRNLRRQRLSEIEIGETPVPMPLGAKLVLHIVPLALGDEVRFDVPHLLKRARGILPLDCGSDGLVATVEGVVSYARTGHRGEGELDTYVLISRMGWLEAVSADILYGEIQSGAPTIASYVLERKLIDRGDTYMRYLSSIGVDPPLYVMLSLTGVKGYVMAGRNTARGRINHSEIVTPANIVESFEVPADILLKPCLDVVWNAAGFEGSQHYNEQGRWTRC